MKLISEIQITPIKPKNGLIAFTSFVLFESFYLSSIGIMTRLNGGYRLLYPTKKINFKQISLFYPINKSTSRQIEEEVIKTYEKVMNNDRYYLNNNTTK